MKVRKVTYTMKITTATLIPDSAPAADHTAIEAMMSKRIDDGLSENSKLVEFEINEIEDKDV